MITNIHARTFSGADPDAVGALLDSAGQADDRVWPKNGRWPPMVLDGPLTDLPAGGHGLVRYHTVDHSPGVRVVWRFEDELGLDGTHELTRYAGVDGPGLRHTISARPVGPMRLLWPLVVRPLHDQCLEDLLDQASVELGIDVVPTDPSRWVRFLLRVGPSPEREEELASKR